MTTGSQLGAGKVFDIGPALDDGRWTSRQKQVVALVASAIVLDGYDNQVLGFAGMVFGTIVGGTLGDRIGRRPALILSVLLFALATAATALVHSVSALEVLRVVAGIGLGAAMPAAATLLAEFSPVHRRSLAVTLGIVCVPLGGVVGGLIASSIMPILGWRALFLIGGIAPLCVALLLFLRLPESPRFLVRRPERWPELAGQIRAMGYDVDIDHGFIDHGEGETRKRLPVKALFGGGFGLDTLSLWCAFFACLLTTYLVFSWAPTLLSQTGLSLRTASLAVAVFNIGGVAGAIWSATLIARYGSKPVMMIAAGGAVLGAIAIVLLKDGSSSEGTKILVMMAIEGALINAVQTSLYALAAHVYPTALRGTGVGAAAGIGRTGAIVSSFLGATILASGWSAYFLSLAIGMAVTLAAIFMIRRHSVPTPILHDAAQD